MNVNYKILLIKYVSHVAAAEGVSFATDVDLAPCGMRSMEFTDKEKSILKQEVFPLVKDWDANPS